MRSYAIICFLIGLIPLSCLAQNYSQYDNQLSQLQKNGQYKEAIPIAKLFVEAAKAEYPGNTWQVSGSLNLLAVLYDQIDDYDHAIPLFEAAIKVQRPIAAPRDTTLANYLYNYGYCLFEMEKFLDAQAPLAEAIAVHQTAGRTMSVRYSHILAHLGLAYMKTGRYLDAKPLFLADYQLTHSRGQENVDLGNSANDMGMICHHLDEYVEAERYYTEALQIRGRLNTTRSAMYAQSVNNLGSLAADKGDYHSADSLYRMGISLLLMVNPDKTDGNYLETVNELARVYRFDNRLDDALHLYRKNFNTIMAHGGGDHPLYVPCLLGLADICDKQQNYGREDTLLHEALRVRLLKDGEHGVRTAAVRGRIGQLDVTLYRPLEAEHLLLQADSVNVANSGERSLDHIHTMNDLANVYSQLSRYPEAGALFSKALQLAELVGGQRHKDYIAALHNYGNYQLSMGHYASADSLFRQAKRIMEVQGWGQLPEYAWVVQSLGHAQRELGYYPAAEQYLQQALTSLQTVYGKSLTDDGGLMDDLAALYLKLGERVKAEDFFDQSLALKKRTFGPESLPVASTLNQLSLMYLEKGDYLEAELAVTQAMVIYEHRLGAAHPDYATTLCNLALIHSNMGNHENAERNYKAALVLLEKTAGGQHSQRYAAMLFDLATNYRRSDDLVKAEATAVRAVDLAHELFGPKNINSLMYEVGLALIYADEKKLSAAETQLKAVIANASEQPAALLALASALDNLAEVFMQEHKYNEATTLIDQSLTAVKRSYGESSPAYDRVLSNAMVLSYVKKDFPVARQTYLKVMSADIMRAEQNLGNLSATEKLNWWSKLTFDGQFGPTLLTTDPTSDNTFVAQVFQQQLEMNGFILDDVAKTLRAAYQSADPGMRQLIKKWQAGEAVLAQQRALPLSGRRNGLKALEDSVDVLEKSISFNTFRQMRNNQKVTLADIRKKLAPDEAAIQFIRYGYSTPDNEKSFRYAAFVLTSTDTLTHFVKLCDEGQLAALVKNQLGTSALYELIGKPLELYLRGMKRLDIAAAGLLDRVAFKALSDPQGQLLLDRFSIRQYLTIRELTSAVPVRVAGVASENLYYGGIDYNNRTIVNQEFAALPAFLKPGVKAGSWPDLPATLQEVTAIVQLSRAHGRIAKVISDTSATKESIIALSGHSPEIIHIATHGFFLPDQSIDGVRNREFTREEDPLFRCGLIMAGANTKDGNGAAKGLLTAYEIANLDLSQTDLVVLSACETAAGDLHGAEGVFGLQRAFRLAGVRQMILSLWKVPDSQTAELMQYFYQNHLQGLAVAESFNKAQQAMRQKYPAFDWAAFELIE